jgi:hypothetical protein
MSNLTSRADKGKEFTRISTEQIDTLWELTRDHSEQDVVLAALAIIGIVRCEECGGRDEHHVDYPMANGSVVRHVTGCSSCHDHGWVRKADDQIDAAWKRRGRFDTPAYSSPHLAIPLVRLLALNYEYDNWLRLQIKHEGNDLLQVARDRLHEMLEEFGAPVEADDA